jgi:putative peptidoglycan lipid II flippase
MGITILTKLLGLFYQILLVNRLGLDNYDKALFDTASVLPDMLANILLIGSLSAAVIPVLSYVRANKGEDRFTQTFVDGLKLFLGIFGLFSIFVIFFAPQLMEFILKYTIVKNNPFDNPANFNELVTVVRLLIIPQVILCTSAFVSSGLQSLKKFIIPQLTGLFYNLGQILGIMIILPVFQIRPLWAIIIGTFLASLFHLSIQIPLLLSTEFWVKFKTDFFKLNFLKKDEDGYLATLQMVTLAFPRIVSSGIEFIMNKYFLLYSLTLGIVSQQRFYYASSLMMIPFSMFVQSYVVIAFPNLSKAFADNDMETFKKTFIETVNKILFYVVPLTAIFLVLRVPFVRLTFGLYPGISKFEWNDTLGIAYLIFFFSIGLIPEVINAVINRVFYSAHNTKIPFLVNLLLISLAILFSSIFIGYFASLKTLNIAEVFFPNVVRENIGENIQTNGASIGGIALAISLANIVVFIINSSIINKKYFKLTFDEYWVTILNKLAAGSIMALAMYLSVKLWEFNVETSTVWVLMVATTSSIAIGLIAYLLTSMFLKVEEAYYLKSKLKSFLYL